MDHKTVKVMPGMYPPFVLLEVSSDAQARLSQGVDYSQKGFEEYVAGLLGIYSRDGEVAVRRCQVSSWWQRLVWWLFQKFCLT